MEWEKDSRSGEWLVVSGGRWRGKRRSVKVQRYKSLRVEKGSRFVVWFEGDKGRQGCPRYQCEGCGTRWKPKLSPKNGSVTWLTHCVDGNFE